MWSGRGDGDVEGGSSMVAVVLMLVIGVDGNSGGDGSYGDIDVVVMELA